MTISPAVTGSTGVSSSTSVVSGSFDPPDNSLIAVFVWSASSTEPTLFSNRSGFSWTKRVSWNALDDGGGETYSYYIYTAPCLTAKSGMTVTATVPFASSSGIKPVAYNGVNLVTPVGATGKVSNFIPTGPYTNNYSPTVYTSTSNKSYGIAMGGDETHLGTPTSTDSIYTTFDGTTYNAMAVSKGSETALAGTSVSFNFNAAGTADAAWVVIGLELLPDSPSQTIIPTGISSGESLGTPKLNLTIQPTGIASGEAFGNAALSLQNLILVQGIPSGESVGIPTLTYTQFIQPSGIPTSEAFGTASLQLGYPQSLTVEGIPSEESVSQGPSIVFRHRIVFRPPSVQEQPMARNRLHIRFGIHRGITVIKRMDGTFYETRYPDQVTVEESAKVYWGGHVNEVSVEDYFALINAGYGSYLSVEELT